MGPVIEAFTAADVRAAEEPLLAAERGFAGGLMHRAATALATAVRRDLRSRTRHVVGTTVVGLIGPGNNGGDTLHALALLADHGVRVTAVLTSAAVHDGGLAALHRSRGRLLALVADAPGRRVDVPEAVRVATGADLVLDGLLGIGGRGGLRGAARELVEALAPAAPAVVAVDLPSGIGVDDGDLPGPVLPARRTVTFGVAKPGLLLPPAAATVGTLEVVDIGLAPVLAEHGSIPAVRRLMPDDVVDLLVTPTPTDHKYSRGVVGVVAGSPAYPGAAVLTVAGALGAGCGMVRHIASPTVRDAVLATHPEVVSGATTDVAAQAWVVGPGVVDDDEQVGRARAAVDHAVESGTPVVVDAGGLHGLPERLPPFVVLTPHAGELTRVLAAHDVTVERAEVEAHPVRWADEAARRTGATILLKGHTTVVVGHGSHGGTTVFAQSEAPTWLATAGSGDVLAGLLGSLLACRAADVRANAELAAELAAAAALIHGTAAALARPGGPVLASEVARALPDAVAGLLAPRPAPRRSARRIRMHHAPLRRVVR